MEPTSSQSTPEIVELERVFKARPERVFDAFASVDAMSQWFGPGHCQVVRGEMDFRIGGTYCLRVDTGSDGEVEVTGEYQAIEPPDFLSFSWRWQGNPEFNPADSVVEIRFEAHADGTLLKLRQIGIENDESRANHGHGWSGAFDKLDKIFT
ncbi:MAG: SRPBCC domain-containing protein [Verrucomicrobiae bacterium]|nr:SRPBCC domain-containing protein [Verrucomicrobiae bacterium]